ncbi:hypothetical protein JZ751_009489 [Albula glossodonta]|uniref:Uncharacterized protein n=1 Tax=Albula glossodonta TaxID=121402 RepID=A0A8T2NXT3_9TELE|nr:hypothetical protein JZ751_009489 [Albula glossodonta]
MGTPRGTGKRCCGPLFLGPRDLAVTLRTITLAFSGADARGPIGFGEPYSLFPLPTPQPVTSSLVSPSNRMAMCTQCSIRRLLLHSPFPSLHPNLLPPILYF